jgi:hypothetical protein
MIYRITKFHIPNVKYSLVIAIKFKTKHNFRSGLIFYILQKKINLTELHIFQRHFRTDVQDTVINGFILVLISQVRTAAILLLLVAVI